jgi:hypothetical protein
MDGWKKSKKKMSCRNRQRPYIKLKGKEKIKELMPTFHRKNVYRAHSVWREIKVDGHKGEKKGMEN